MDNSVKSETQGTISGRNKSVGVCNIQIFKIMGFGGLNHPSKGLARQLKITQNKLSK